MDPVDVRICQLLIHNSRISYRDLAQKLETSVQAVHRRVQRMVGTGVIKGFTTKISIGQLGGVAVHVFGSSESSSLEDTALELGKNGCTETVWISGDFMIVHGILRNVSDLDSFLEYAKSQGRIRKPTIGIFGGVQSGDVGQVYAPTDREQLSPLDYRIINSMRNDSRKEIAVIAQELRVSTGTIRRHLDRLIQKGSLEMNIVFYPGYSSGMTNVLGITVAEGASRNALIGELESTFGSKFIAFMPYMNIDSLMLAFVWADTVAEMLQIEESLKTHEKVASFWTYTLQRKFQFDTWRDKLLTEKAGELGKGNSSK